MKNLKRTIFIITLLLICIILFSFIMLSNNILTNQSKVLTLHDYLKTNFSNIDFENNTYSFFKIMEDDIRNVDMVLTGESHGNKSNFYLYLLFIKYLKSEIDIKYILSEMSYSSSCFLNKYLETGNEDYLYDSISTFKGKLIAKEYIDFYRELYDFNKTLPKNKKLEIVGIDLEMGLSVAIKYLYSIIPSKEVPSIIQEDISQLKDIYFQLDSLDLHYSNNDRLIIKEFSENLKYNVERNYDLYHSYLGKDFFNFNLINENILNYLNLKPPKKENWKYNLSTRDFHIYNNFIKIHNHLPKGKYFGQWGLFHTYQNVVLDDVESFSTLLLNRKDSPMKNRVLSIGYLYKNCEMRMSPFVDSKFNSTYDETTEIFEPYIVADFTLFKLNGNGSPFKEKLIYPTIKHYDWKFNGTTTDYMQYIILIQNSKPYTFIEVND